MNYDKKAAKHPHLVKETDWTVEDYYQLPEDGNQYEIIKGRLELKPSPTSTHQRISIKLIKSMMDSCENDYIMMSAPIDVILSDNETRQPDIVVIHRSRESIIEERGVIGPPDLVVEIISPTSAKRDRTMKKASYAYFGIPEYWIVDPTNLTIEQYVLMGQGEPYELLEVFGAEDVLHSERIPCAVFKVKDVLTL